MTAIDSFINNLIWKMRLHFMTANERWHWARMLWIRGAHPVTVCRRLKITEEQLDRWIDKF